jgi:PII-like signaling protein
MKSEAAAKRVTVFVGESDRHAGVPLYEAIVTMLHAEGIAGATALRGVLGYGATGHTHSAHLLDLSSDLPIAVVFVDSAEKIDAVLPKLDSMVESGLVTVEDVLAIRYVPAE